MRSVHDTRHHCIRASVVGRLSRQTLVLALVCLGFLALLANAEEPRRGGTLTLPLNGNPKMWPLVGSLPNILVNKVLYNYLLKYDPDTLAPRGDLAESWGVSRDGQTWTFHLRKHVKWHDGHPLTARDVKFSFEVRIDPNIPFYLRGNLAGLERVDVVDDHTVNMVFDEYKASLPVILGYLMDIIPEHLLKGYAPQDLLSPTEFLQRPIGTGPFKFKEFVPNSHVTLVANEEYFEGRPHLDAIVFKTISDLDVQVAQLQTGALDFVPIEPHQLQAVAGMPNIDTRSARQVNYTFIAFNHTNPLFQDKRVRQALTYGIDRAALLKTVALGKGILATSPISPFLEWAYNKRLEPYPYDVKKAAALLSAVGWQPGPDGILRKDGKRFSFSINFDRGNPVREQTAIIAQEYWKAIGIETKLEAMEFNALSRNTRSRPPKYEAYVGFYVTPPDPDLTAYYGTDGGTNVFAYSSAEVDRLLEQGRTSSDPQVRADVYSRMQAAIAEDAPVVFLYYPYEMQAVHKKVQNWPAVGYRDGLKYAHQFWLK
jgi:peptide/nickel transport system substrate-binding protein